MRSPPIRATLRGCTALAWLMLSGCGEGPDTVAGAPSPGGCGVDEVPLVDGGCSRPGVPPSDCGVGFEADEHGGCRPILPAEPCADGEMAVPGDVTCHEVAPCGASPWGDIPIEPNTQLVDGSYALGDSDGSADKPWTTIGDAILAAEAGAIVAIAGGSYQENVLISSKPVRLWGRCPKLVEIVGGVPAIGTIDIRASATELRHLAVRTASSEPTPPVVFGVASSGATGVILAGLWIHDTSGRGVSVEDTLGPTEMRIEGSLIERTREGGVVALGARATLVGSVVRDTMSNATANTRGVGAEINVATGLPAEVTIEGSVVDRSEEVGVLLSGSSGLLEASVVRGTLPQADGTRGIGVVVQDFAPYASSAIVDRCLIEKNRLAGILASGGTTSVWRTVLSRNESQLSDGTYGRGLACEPSVSTGARAELEVTSSVVEENQEAGIAAFACDATIDATIVRDTVPRASDATRGRGINVQSEDGAGRSMATVRNTLVSGNHSMGILVFESDVVVDSSLVRLSQPLLDGRFGDGLLAMRDATLTVERVHVVSNTRAGIVNFSSTVRLEQGRLECNPIQLNGEDVDGPFSFEDRGGNVCSCGEQIDDCRVQSAHLEPPGPAD